MVILFGEENFSLFCLTKNDFPAAKAISLAEALGQWLREANLLPGRRPLDEAVRQDFGEPNLFMRFELVIQGRGKARGWFDVGGAFADRP